MVCDSRHFNINILSYGEVNERSFSCWTMALATEVKNKKKLYLKYGYSNQFNPYQISPLGALSFLRELGAIYM
ncbi:MAG: hypothetical protein AB8G05_08335 [Oligoflexales bacterium]